ncbi:MAG: WecB/TagA/CpsF family glycosyltransferase, partial [Pseudomonadota bacterium]
MSYASTFPPEHMALPAMPPKDLFDRAPAPRLETRLVLGVDVVDASSEAVIATLLDGERRRVAFLNAHCANVMSRDPAYADAVATADLVLPDGIGVELAARMSGENLTENLNGTDLTPKLMRAAAQRGLSVFLFGAEPGTAEAAANRLCHLCPGLRIAGTRDGFKQAEDTEGTIAQINASGADIVLVAMGVPRQDLWLAQNASRLNAWLCLGVGALFDFLSGRVERAPDVVQRLRLEWGWRLMKEPRRLAGRYLIGNATFMVRAARDAMDLSNRDARAKRLFDLALAGGGLFFLMPLFAIVALAIRLDSKGPVFFCQTRIGRNGRPFRFYKFRSMHVDAEARKAALLAQSDRDGA